MVRQLIKVFGLVQMSLLLSLFATNSYAQAPWSQYNYTSKNVNIYHQKRGQRFDLSRHINIRAGEYLDDIKLVVSSRYNYGQLALIKNGELVASNNKLSPELSVVSLPFKQVIRRGDKFEIVTTEEVHISNVGATFEVVRGGQQGQDSFYRQNNSQGQRDGRYIGDAGDYNPNRYDRGQAQSPRDFDMSLIRNCEWSSFQPQFVAGLNKPTQQTRTLKSGRGCRESETRAMPNCYKYRITNTGGVTGVRFLGASSDKKQNFVRSDQSSNGTVCLKKGKSSITVMKLDNPNMQTRLILAPLNSNKATFDQTFAAGDQGDQFLSRWYRKNFTLNH